MKRTFMALCLFSFIATPAFAFSEASISCPQAISCSLKSDKHLICEIAQGDSQYWAVPQGVFPGVYYLSSVVSGFEGATPSSSFYRSTRCQYLFEQDRNYGAYIEAKVESNLVADNNSGAAWIIHPSDPHKNRNDKNNQPKATCDLDSPSHALGLCPLKVGSSLIIRNTTGIRMTASINGVEYPQISNNTRIGLDAVSNCGEQKICKIDIVGAKHEVFGTVSVDTDNKMKITDIASNHPLVSIKELGFNFVEIILKK